MKQRIGRIAPILRYVAREVLSIIAISVVIMLVVTMFIIIYSLLRTV